jgi:hypothetical protein
MGKRVTGVDELLERLFAVAFALVWLGGALVLGFRAWRQHVAYLRRFPPVAGVRLDDLVAGRAFRLPWSAANRAANRALWRRQDDPELERLRRAVWRGYGYYFLWIVAVPLLTAGVVAPLVVPGLMRPR